MSEIHFIPPITRGNYYRDQACDRPLFVACNFAISIVVVLLLRIASQDRNDALFLASDTTIRTRDEHVHLIHWCFLRFIVLLTHWSHGNHKALPYQTDVTLGWLLERPSSNIPGFEKAAAHHAKEQKTGTILVQFLLYTVFGRMCVLLSATWLWCPRKEIPCWIKIVWYFVKFLIMLDHFNSCGISHRFHEVQAQFTAVMTEACLSVSSTIVVSRKHCIICSSSVSSKTKRFRRQIFF